MKKNILKTALMLLAAVGGPAALAQTPHVYINPGHGGHDSDDRNVPCPPFAAGDTAGFWESNASLKKGFALQEMLRKKGYKTSISRITNDSESDLALSTIVALCNQSGADVFYAIHSNATGAGEGYRINTSMGIYRGYTGSPQVPGSDSLAACLGPFLMANKSTVWTSDTYSIYGDWTFYPSWGTQGLGVLRGNKAVSMLNEGTFHDYIPETYRLINPYYCWVEGFNFSLGADSYFHRLGNYDKGFVTGNVRDSRLLRDAKYVMHGDDVRQPVNNATAYLIDASGKTIDTCQIDAYEDGIYLFKFIEPGNYKVRITEPSHYEQTKDVVVTANGMTYCNFDLNRVRNTPPEVLSYSPVWADGDAAVACNEPVVMQFNWDMDPATTEKAFTITPAVEGTFTWEDTNYRLVFKPTDAYDVNTTYTVKLASTAEHAGGTAMGKDVSFKFRTRSRNHLAVLATYPGEGDRIHITSPVVEIRTDSMLSPGQFNNVHVTDEAGNVLSINTRGVRKNKAGDDYGYVRIPLSKALVEGQTYKVTFDKIISDTAGLYIPQTITHTFKAVNEGAEKAGSTLIDGFDTAGQCAVNAGESSDYTTAKVATVGGSSKLFGNMALQLTYAFAERDKGRITVDLTPAEQGFTSADNVGIHVFGDMCYNTLYGKFVAGTDVKLVKLSNITYHGWRYENVPLTALTQGQTYKLEGLVLDKCNGVMGKSGAIRFDNVLCTQGESGVSEVEVAGVEITSGPDYIVASADTYVQGMELYSMAGQRVAANSGNFINVTAVSSGAYVVKVYVGGRVAVKKVVVAHK